VPHRAAWAQTTQRALPAGRVTQADAARTQASQAVELRGHDDMTNDLLRA